MKNRILLITLTELMSTSALANELVAPNLKEAANLVGKGYDCSEVTAMQPSKSKGAIDVTFRIMLPGRKPVTKTDAVPADSAAKIYKIGKIMCSNEGE